MATITSPRTQSPASTPRIKSPSIAETPTSSTRGSFELHPNARSTQQPQRRGNRAALREFYNLKSKPGQPQTFQNAAGPGQLSRTASIASTTSELTNATLTEEGNASSTTSDLTAPLDSTDFEARPYVDTLLSTSSLREILRVEATLVSEIRNLDGDRKALVYDNYSKLIKAVGTIGQMQRSMNETPGGGLSEVGELEGKLEGLRGMVRDITQAKSEEDRKRDEERRRLRRQAKELEKNKDSVRWVLGAPERFRKLIEEDRGEEAERQWETVKAYLDKWEGVKGVDRVRTACEEILAASEVEDENVED